MSVRLLQAFTYTFHVATVLLDLSTSRPPPKDTIAITMPPETHNRYFLEIKNIFRLNNRVFCFIEVICNHSENLGGSNFLLLLSLLKS
jgi:hypothetical protein